MFNRRFLRIKVFQALYAYFQNGNASRSVFENTMVKSLQKVSDLYIFLLAFPAEFRFYLEKENDMQLSKHIRDNNIFKPLNGLLNNKAITALAGNEELTEKIKSAKVSWSNSSDLLKHIFTVVKESELLNEYIQKDTHSFDEDKKLLSEIYEIIIGESDLFNQYLEEQFLNWEDDQVIVTISLLKTIQSLKETANKDFINKFELTDSEDIDFMKQLFHKTVDQEDEFLKLIADKTKNWEADRIAFVDMLLMKMALCEILSFPNIPVKVSINEYLELAKLYSTPNSHGFINGVLDKIQIDLRKENKIEKQGRGLVE